MAKRNFVDKCFKNSEGRVVIFQMPNFPIIVWFISSLLGKLFSGTFGQIMSMIAFGALFTWAWLELFDGANYFRRALGLMVLVFVIWNRI